MPPQTDQPSDSHQPTRVSRRICLIRHPHDLASPTVAWVDLAALLCESGHVVTVLDVNAVSDREATHSLFGLNPNLQHICLPPIRLLATPCAQERDSYALYEWLRERRFDVIVMSFGDGIGFHSLAAKTQGIAFPNTLFCLVAQTPSQKWIGDPLQFPTGHAAFRIDFMQRSLAAQVDVLIAQDETTLAALAEQQYKLPSAVRVAGSLSELRTESTQTAWLAALTETPIPLRKPALSALAEQSAPPLVSVGLVTFNRPQLLRQAVDSLCAQDYPQLEVILVDDGSSDPDAVAALDELAPIFANRGWQILRQTNRYLGAARNAAAHMARGKYLLFMDDDNVAKPHEVRTLVSVAEYTEADIVTCHLDRFSSTESPLTKPMKTEPWGPLGAALSVGLTENVFGDANALIRKRSFDAIGGFTELRGVGHEDWEFFAKACLQGHRLDVVPESLFYYRVLPGSMLSSSKQRANLLRSATPYLHGQPLWLRQILLGYLGQHLELRAPSGGQPVLTDAPALSDDDVLRLKNRIYDALRPYPRALNLIRRSAQAVFKLAQTK